MDMRETRISGEYFFEGRIMKARVDEVRLPNGKQASREVCEHVGGVGVLPIDRDGNIILVRQFRYPFDTETLEMPAGKMDHGPENAEECGVRELAEETGCTAGRIVPLGAMYPSPGFLTEVTYLFAALDLTEGETHPDEDEFVETVRLPIAEVERLIAPARNRRIRKEYNGFNIKELAQAYDLTTNQIMNIVKEIDPQQISLFDYDGFDNT